MKIVTNYFWLSLIFFVFIGFIGFNACSASSLGSTNSSIISDHQLIYQQERQKALESALSNPLPDVRFQAGSVKHQTINFPSESPCFQISSVELLERDTLPYIIPLYPILIQAEGQCLGGEGINLLMSRLQDQIISYGYITTRVVAPEQDLTGGKLSLLLVKGVVSDIYYTEDSDTHSSLQTAVPVKKGFALNLRDIEQGLENLQRIPTVKAQMQLVPGKKNGESDIVISRTQSKHWRIGLSLDDSGTKDTGRYQGGMTLYLDDPLGMSDAFYVSGGHDINRNSRYGSKNYLFSYSVPMGYWLLNTSLNSNVYHQTVAGIYDYEYSGRSRNINTQISRVIHRNDTQKTTLTYGLNFKESHNYIDNSEVDVQYRRTSNWMLGLQHRHYFANTTLDFGAIYKKGVRWFGAIPAPEEYSNYGSALSDIFNVNASFVIPFTFHEKNFRYNLDYQGQFSRGNNLTPPERFSIGGRWSVRGFDGGQSLSADNGWFVRNDLSWLMPINNEFYMGVDYGEVSGANSGYLLGKKLAGSALGVRGSLYGIYYDAFVGIPLYKPDGFKTDNVTLGFYLNWNY